MFSSDSSEADSPIDPQGLCHRIGPLLSDDRVS
jgi:hypothetical protein